MSNNGKIRGLLPKYRFPEFISTGEWRTYTLGDISERIIKKVGSKRLITLSISAGIGFVSQAEKFSRDISGKQYENYIHLYAGELSYNKGNSKRFPQGCIYELKEYDEAAVPSAFISFRFKHGYVSDFFKGYFENNFHGAQLKRFITSGARSDGLLNINPADFFSIILHVPKDIAEQQKIADCLSSLDDLIAAENKKLEALKTHKKALMQKLFPSEGKTVPDVRFPGFTDAWEQRRLGDYLVPHTEVTTENNQYPVLTSSRQGVFLQTDYYNGNQVASKDNTGYNVVPRGYFTYRHMSDDEIFKFNINDIVDRGIVSTLYPVFTTSEELDSKYLQYQLNYGQEFQSFAILQKQGGSRTYMYLNKLNELKLTMSIDVEEQKRISSFFTEIDYLITLHQRKVESLKIHKKGLMQGLFPSVQEVIE